MMNQGIGDKNILIDSKLGGRFRKMYIMYYSASLQY